MDELVSKVVVDRAKDIYDDGLKPVTVEAGQMLGTIMGWFHNVALYPLQVQTLNYKHKLEQFSTDLQDKISNIPEQDRIEPTISIVGPTLEALKYTVELDDIRNMYAELLASSVNAKKVKDTHPSFIEIIKSLSPLDAVILKKIAIKRQIPNAHVVIGFSDKVFTSILPTHYVPDIIDDLDPLDVSKSIQSLIRLGLITLIDGGTQGINYDEFKDHKFIKTQFDYCKNSKPNETVTIKVTGKTLRVNEFGRSFELACIS